MIIKFTYENETYTYLRKNLPDVGDVVHLEEGDGKVLSVDVLKREIKVKMFEDEKFLTVGIEAVKSIKNKKERNNDGNKD